MEGQEKKPSHKKETIGFIAAILLMVAALFTVWQVFLKGKVSQEHDTIVQLKVDTLKIKDSLNNVMKTSPNPNTSNEIKSAPDTTHKYVDSLKSKIVNRELTTEDKKRLKEEFSSLPKKKQEKIKRKLLKK